MIKPCTCEGWKINLPYTISYPDNPIATAVSCTLRGNEYIFCPWCGIKLEKVENEKQ